MSRAISFEDAKRAYVHRFTMEHVPGWSRTAMTNGRYYAPQYRTDAEWYAATTFPGEGDLSPRARHCESIGQTWPLGESLDQPFRGSR